MDRDIMEFDVVIVGAGPAGLAAAVRLGQLARERKQALSVCVLEKGSEVGAHILSGAVLDPRPLDELLPGWRDRDHGPTGTPVTEDGVRLLGQDRAWSLPVPPTLRNHGNLIIGLGGLCRWLAREAEALGVDIFPGFPAADLVLDDHGRRVVGVLTRDMGVGRDGLPTASFQAGAEVRASFTLLAEGCRGSLAGTLERRFDLRRGADPQRYGLGIKELWEVEPSRHRPGRVLHTIGWPLDRETYGGGFLYHLEDNQVAVGLIVGLDYRDPFLDPFQEMQRLKTHPALRGAFEGGRRIAYGARVLDEGGVQALPRLTVPGAALIGSAAGFVDVPRIKGIHTAMKSGMLAAEAVFSALERGEAEATAYPESLRKSWVWEDLHRSRNVRPAFRWGLWPGLAHAALQAYLLRGKEPWTLHHRRPDHETLRPTGSRQAPPPLRPDGVLTFDRMSSVQLANTGHEENQPCHLLLADPEAPLRVNLARHAGPEQRYCPAGVFEFVDDTGAHGGKSLRINATNCLHCKTCDIKDPGGNIFWTPPEGGGGPNYPNM